MTVQYKERDGGAMGFDIRGQESGTPCSVAHPGNPALPVTAEEQDPNQQWHWCRKLKGHPGPHAAYTSSIKEPEEWD